ncbi:MAG: helix-turn-helix transcriptional regulator [Oscillospiraceae bacterium]|nr:helix-turn-helix transcriptional regulator [Oscillospiraceae bacterium]
MAVRYNKLWKMMIDKDMNKTQLRKAAQISTNAIAKLSKNEQISMDTLTKICDALQCDIGDIVEYVGDNKEQK